VIDDYDVVSARAFAEPYLDELRALVRVCGDHFETHGDPRGTLIALGEARHDATGKRAYELQDAIDAHVLVHHRAEIAGIEDVLGVRRTCTLEWRAGKIYGAQLDLRRVTHTEVTVRALLAAPAARWLRRLVVRVRQDRHIAGVADAMRWHEPAAPLEELYILREVRPRRFAGWESSSAPWLGAHFPTLYAYAERDAIYSLMPADQPYEAARLVRDVLACTAPLDPFERRLIGRSLTSPEASVRAAALDWLGRHPDDATVFVDLLALLLQPGVLAPQLPVLACLRALGRRARRALPVLTRMPGRTNHYDRATRSDAGALLATLR